MKVLFDHQIFYEQRVGGSFSPQEETTSPELQEQRGRKGAKRIYYTEVSNCCLASRKSLG